MSKKLRLCLTIILSGVIAMVAATCIILSANAKSYNTNGAMAFAIAPEITIQYPSGYSESNIPNAVKDVEYKIFDATAKDLFGKTIGVSTKVYSHYNSENKALIGLYNGCVKPKSYGVYTVEYKAQDAYGNTAVLLYDFICEPKEDLIIELSTSKIEEGYCGNAISVSPFVAHNSIGQTKANVYAKLNGTDIVYNVGENLFFVPMYSGKYQIVYEVSDYNQTATNNYFVNVLENEVPVIFEEAQLSRYYIVGYEYNLPLVKCYHFAYGKPMAIQTQVSAKIENNREFALTNGVFKPDKEGETIITYSATYNGTTVKKEYKVVCVDVGYGTMLNMGEYFEAVSGSINFENLSKGVEISTAVNQTLVDFINPVSMAKFELHFGIKPESNFNQLDIYLSDYVDSENVVKISVINNQEGNAYFILNDIATEKFATEINFRELSTIKLIYNEKTRQISLGESYNITITTTLDGGRFNGFNNASAYISFGFSEVVETSGIIVYKINNQSLSKATKDSIAPQLVFYAFDEGIKHLGETVEIDRIYVSDVLSPNSKVYYTVNAPDGSIVTSLDGVWLENADYTRTYSFKVDQLGTYIVSMRVVDTAYRDPNEQFLSYSINVKDGVAPTISLSAKGTLSVKAGGVIDLRKPVFVDDISTELITQIYVLRPDYVIDYIEDISNLKYKTTMKGEYIIYYYAMDEAKNVTMVNYSVVAD